MYGKNFVHARQRDRMSQGHPRGKVGFERRPLHASPGSGAVPFPYDVEHSRVAARPEGGGDLLSRTIAASGRRQDQLIFNCEKQATQRQPGTIDWYEVRMSKQTPPASGCQINLDSESARSRGPVEGAVKQRAAWRAARVQCEVLTTENRHRATALLWLPLVTPVLLPDTRRRK